MIFQVLRLWTFQITQAMMNILSGRLMVDILFIHDV